MNIREIKDLIQLMNEHKLAEVEVEQEGMKVKLRKAESGVVVKQAPIVQAIEPAQAAPPVEAEKKPKGKAIVSPMVGTYYSAPAPDAEPYVKAGGKVEVGQVVCIVEAMKLMNEIKSEINGTISEIHMGNGQPVEFDQPLFTVI